MASINWKQRIDPRMIPRVLTESFAMVSMLF